MINIRSIINFIEDDLPLKLQDYQLVAGTAEVREILPRELEVIDF